MVSYVARGRVVGSGMERGGKSVMQDWHPASFPNVYTHTHAQQLAVFRQMNTHVQSSPVSVKHIVKAHTSHMFCAYSANT